jgi:integrase
MRFDLSIITDWLRRGPLMTDDDKARIEQSGIEIQKQFPEELKKLKDFENQFSYDKQPKYFSLSKVKNKRHGFLYYVRYIDIESRKLVPSRWCTHTNDKEEAEKYAVENRERILKEYTYKKNEGMYAVLAAFYKEGSKYLENERNHGRRLGTKTRSMLHNFAKKVLMPFLRRKKIQNFEEITPPVINDLQNYLLKKGNKPQTINKYMGCLKAVLNYMVMHGRIKENVFSKAVMLRVNGSQYRVRQCYKIDSLKGVFKNPWEDNLSYLLCLVIYSTGMRNSEIEKIRAIDLIRLNGNDFINIQNSKTESGTRRVPLHPFVHKKLLAHISANNYKADDYIFSKNGRHIQSPVYRKANADMGNVLKINDVEKQGISFYSGRHFWKTLMSSEGLGDIEEYFMGHKVTSEVKNLYNHLDKQGQKKLIKKTREVFKILDRYIF